MKPVLNKVEMCLLIGLAQIVMILDPKDQINHSILSLGIYNNSMAKRF
jgi:hypothetical protein